MSRYLIALWIALIAAIASITGLAFFWNSQRSQMAVQRVEDILQLQLEPFRRSISEVLAEYSLILQKEVGSCNWSDLQACVQLTRLPLADSVVVADRDLQLHFPSDPNLSTDRRSLIDEAMQLIREQMDPRKVAQAIKLDLERGTDAPSLIEEVGLFRARSYSAQSNRATSPPIQATGAKSAAQQQSIPEIAQSEMGSEELAQQFSRSSAAVSAMTDNRKGLGENFGWITWYHRRGIVLGFWWQDGADWRSIVVLPRARWMADVVARLPESASGIGPPLNKLNAEQLSGSLVQLTDVEGNVIYQWGSSPESEWNQLASGHPAATLPLNDPLEGWRLQVFASAELRERLSGDTLILPLSLAVAGLSAALLLVGALVTVNVNRQLRLAERRVSFVNQVSHELRTPLTNICMYADLLASSLKRDFADPMESDGVRPLALHSDQPADVPSASQALERIGIIQSESQRLSRLISNVLEFARQEKRAGLRTSPIVLDHIVRDVVETFRPRLEQSGLTISLELNTAEPRQIDSAAVEQILINLISNAEKYAANGKRIAILTRSEGDFVIVDVVDFGPGIPRRWAEKVFVPFTRMSDRLEDPAGTGIGLTIVRQLCKDHGGDCNLVPTTVGATFRCRLLAKLHN